MQQWVRDQMGRDPAFLRVMREQAWRQLYWAEELAPAETLSRRGDAKAAWAKFWVALEAYRDACIAFGRLDPHRTNPRDHGAVLKAGRERRDTLDAALRELLAVFGAETTGQNVGEWVEACRKLSIPATGADNGPS